MSGAEDKLLRALQTGDTACPDGSVLARLGAMVRSGSDLPRRPDLARGVLAACRDQAGMDRVEADEEALIDSFYDGEEQEPRDGRLERLRRLVREAARLERRPDILPRLEAELEAAEAAEHRYRNQRMEHGTQWRIWTMVIGGHVAALLVLTLLQVHRGPSNLYRNDIDRPAGHEINLRRLQEMIRRNERAGVERLRLPGSWDELRDDPDLLFVLRRSPNLRDHARLHYGSQDCRATTRALVAWLVAQQDQQGFFGRDGSAPKAALGVQGLALLALLGEGVEPQAHRRAIDAGFGWLLERRDERGAFPIGPGDGELAGILALACTEGAVLCDRPELQWAAEGLFRRRRTALVAAQTDGGLCGFALQAVIMGDIYGFDLPDGLLAAMRAAVCEGRPATDDPGSLGVVAYARLITGDGLAVRTRKLVARIPGTAVDQRRIRDPLGWYFATLALREQGGEDWRRWQEQLAQRLLTAVDYAEDMAWVPGERVSHAGGPGRVGLHGDVLATALTALNFQVAYRYLPVDPSADRR